MALRRLRDRGGLRDRRAAGDRRATWPPRPQQAGVAIVTGDTKVVGKGAADGLYITTAGVGVLPADRRLGADLVQPGDVVLVSGTLADHGMAVMLARGDSGPRGRHPVGHGPARRSRRGRAATLLRRHGGCATRPGAAWRRSATSSPRTPVWRSCSTKRHCRSTPRWSGACDLLGIDPLYVANEGKVVVVVPPDEADAALAAMRAHPFGRRAARIGEVRRRARRPCRAAHDVRRHADRRHARRRSPAAHLLGRSWTRAHQLRVTGTVQGVGLSTVRLSPRRRARSQRLRAQRQRRGPHRRGGRCPNASRSWYGGCRRGPATAGTGRRRHHRTARADECRDRGFRIVESEGGGGPAVPVSIDSATCDDCLAEIFDPHRSPLPLPVHQLHQLRSAVHDRARRAVRPPGDDDGAVPRCAPTARRSTTIRPTVGSTPNPTPVRAAVPS